MSTEIKKEVIGQVISRGRRMSIITYVDGTAMISVDSTGVGLTLHLDEPDIKFILESLNAG